MACPDENALLGFVEGSLDDAEAGAIERHLDGCDLCREVVVAVARDGRTVSAPSGPAGALPEPLPRGFSLGRYLVLERVGAGGMGVVYSAYDPQLERRVAVKLLRSGFDPDRLVREARAMAKVSHPNVIAVLDVGRAGEGAAFIAMDLVGGASLDQWLHASPRSWKEIVDAFLQAGRGLGAAHAAGIVHGDFKPANVLVGNDGRVRVGDFGLAQPSGEARDGGAGTPAYMAPEQAAGLPADARADQYSFCLSLWEALAGERPHDAMGMRPPPKGRAPAWVWQVLGRGLSTDPAQRHRSLDELFDALESDPDAARRRVFGMVAGLALIVALPVGTWLAAESRGGPCSGSEAKLAGVWDSPRRVAVRSAAGTGVESALDEWAGRWTGAREEACRATRVRGEQSERLLDVRMACLDRQLHDARELVSALAQADEKRAMKAMSAVAALPSPDACADAATLLAAPVVPPEKSEAVARLEALRAQAAALERLGSYKDALVLARAASGSAATLGWAPLDAETHLLEGRAAQMIQAWDRAAPAFERAAWKGIAARNAKLAAHARTALVMVSIDGDADLKTAERRLAEARDVLDSIDPPDLRGEADWYGTLSNLRAEQNRLDDAIAASATALELGKRVADADPADTAYARRLMNHGGLLYAREDYDGALAGFRGCRERLEAVLGKDHPDVAYVRVNEGAVLFIRGKYQEALDVGRAALAVLGKSMGADSLVVATVRNNIAKNLLALGRPEEAEKEFRASVAVIEKGLGADHPDAARGWVNVSDALSNQGKLDEAWNANERAVKIYLGAGDPSEETVWALGESATKLRKLGRFDEADARARRALALSIEVSGTQAEITGRQHQTLGEIAFQRSRFPEAVRELRRGVEVMVKARGVNNPATADARVHLSMALASSGKKAEAIEQLRLAVEQCKDCPGYPYRAEYRKRLGEALAAEGRAAEAAPHLAAAASLAREALAAIPAGKDSEADRAEIQAWIETLEAGGT